MPLVWIETCRNNRATTARLTGAAANMDLQQRANDSVAALHENAKRANAAGTRLASIATAC